MTPDPHMWPPCAAIDLWALKVKLAAACVRGEARQGWVPCRVVRRAIGVAK
jgi:hypothetical protein